MQFRHLPVHLRGQQTTDGRGVAAETGAPASTWNWKWNAAAVSARGRRWWGTPPRHPGRRIRRVGLCAAQRQVLTDVLLTQGCFGDF